MRDRLHEHVLAAEPEARLQWRRLPRLVLLVDVVEGEAPGREHAGVLSKERVEVERVVEAVRVDDVDGSIGLLEPVEVADADQLVLGAGIQVDAVRPAKPEFPEHLDLGPLPRAEAEDDGVARHELHEVPEPPVETRPRLGHRRIREAIADPQDLVELLPLVVDVLIVGVVVAPYEPLVVRRQQAFCVVVLRTHWMLVALMDVAGVGIAPELPVVAEASRCPPVERLSEPERCGPADVLGGTDAPFGEDLTGRTIRFRPMRMSIVVDTYEWPEALHAVLLGLADQSDQDFDVVVADDGSGAETAALVDGWKEYLRLTHVRQDDDGYRLARVRNLGALAAEGDYLVFVTRTPCRGATSCGRSQAAVPAWFLAGTRLLLSRALTGRVLADRIPIQRWSLPHWALHPGEAKPLTALTPRDRRRPWRDGMPEFVPHADGYGFLLGISREDLQRVNGYDMRFAGWGGEDVDMAVRLRRAGLRCGWGGPRDPPAPLARDAQAGRRPNDPLLRETEAGNRIVALEGLRELADAR